MSWCDVAFIVIIIIAVLRVHTPMLWKELVRCNDRMTKGLARIYFL